MPDRHYVFWHRRTPGFHRYAELTRWQRTAMGYAKFDMTQPHRRKPMKYRFNPEGVALTKGTSHFAYQWWFSQYPFLANLPPDGWQAPQSIGKVPKAWDPEFTEKIHSLDDAELHEQILDRLVHVIHDETQRDGYELRQLDFEGKPLEVLPDRKIIKNFILEEETMRDRVIGQVIETDFRLTPTSSDRRELRTVENIVGYIMTHVHASRSPETLDVTDAVKTVLAAQLLQPILGFHHALPVDTRDRHVQEWERLHHHDWQFGKAVYTPRSVEATRGNFVWLRMKAERAKRDEFRRHVESGEAKVQHLAIIEEAQKVQKL